MPRFERTRYRKKYRRRSPWKVKETSPGPGGPLRPRRRTIPSELLEQGLLSAIRERVHCSTVCKEILMLLARQSDRGLRNEALAAVNAVEHPGQKALAAGRLAPAFERPECGGLIDSALTAAREEEMLVWVSETFPLIAASSRLRDNARSAVLGADPPGPYGIPGPGWDRSPSLLTRVWGGDRSSRLDRVGVGKSKGTGRTSHPPRGARARMRPSGGSSKPMCGPAWRMRSPGLPTTSPRSRCVQHFRMPLTPIRALAGGGPDSPAPTRQAESWRRSTERSTVN